MGNLVNAIRGFLLILVFALLPAYAQDQNFSGRVVGITDGDTLTILTASTEQVRIRLAEIDTPEKGQPYGNRSQQTLSTLTFQKEIFAKYVDTDRYGRIVARLYVDDLDISAEMVRLGAAWVYRYYSTDESLRALEKQAQQSGVGLWSLPEFERIPPWEWRRGIQPK